MKDGFIRVAAATPLGKVADCDYNAGQIIHAARKAAENKVSLLVTPELGITGYTCGDLFNQQLLLEQAERALVRIGQETAELPLVLIVGLPLRQGGKLYNCAAVLCRGKVLGFVPKTHLPGYSEFYELRNFTPANSENRCYQSQKCLFEGVIFGARQLFQCSEWKDFTLAVEVCEDLWVPAPPSINHAQAGATVIANLSASDETIGKADYRRALVNGQSARLVCGYIYADAGRGESTTDMVFAGHNLIAENGTVLAESKLFSDGLVYSELDLGRIAQERRRQTTFPPQNNEGYQTSFFSLPVEETPLSRTISPAPFVPADTQDLEERCETILGIQAAGLRKRLEHTGAETAVIGVSGGLDSALALLVTARAYALLNRDPANILAVTMPGFGTTSRTRNNAEELCKTIGATLKTVDISDTVRAHFKDIGQDEGNHDVVYENAQARVRTLVLMDLANQKNGLVVGTGDLSELALGWATYNGDHMSMYGVNASVPKTLIRSLVAHEGRMRAELADVLADILDTPVSPELLPAENGEISQQTEQLVGPYELHDFFLYYVLRWGFAPRKVYRLAKTAFSGRYDNATILTWLRTFYRRFFSQQFKRSCLPDGPKVGSVSLSPRGDWRMPSDASAAGWLKELEKLSKENR